MDFRNPSGGRNYQLNEDAYAGFQNAVKTNRTALALEYAGIIIEDLRGKLEEQNQLVAQVQKLEDIVSKLSSSSKAKQAKVADGDGS